ncbi:MAG: hypothetical protein ACO1NU_07140 [Arcticibacter sp.]
MECQSNNNDPVIREIADQFDTLQKVADELRLGNYKNEDGDLVCNPAFLKLEQLARQEQPVEEDVASNGMRYEEEQLINEPFHVEADIYDSGDYAHLLVIPSAGNYIVVGENEHLTTLTKTCDEPECWDQVDGSLDEEVVEVLGREISNYLSSI